MTDNNKQVTKYKRFEQTLEFMKESLPKGSKILDLGTPNDMSEYLINYGYKVDNAYGVDFDLNPRNYCKEGYDAVTMFEVLEHLINPMGILAQVKAPKLFASVPLSLWFAKAYRNKSDEWDQHFHEFEDWQFDWLVEKSGWKIPKQGKMGKSSSENWFQTNFKEITPRYYIIEAER